jgi:periplasmic protein TonB
MVHAIRSAASLHPDATRIAGLAGAITINVALLLLLLTPMSVPPPQPEHETIRVVDIFDRIKPPAPPPVPVPVPVTTPRLPSTASATPHRMDVPPAAEQAVVEDGALPADPVVETASEAVPSLESSTPLPGVRLEYLQASAPAYPRDALRDGVQGTVMLQVLVDVDGRPLEVQVQHSSGNRQLDNAARRQVLEHWTFRPAMKDGRAVQAIGLVPIAFNLDR